MVGGDIIVFVLRINKEIKEILKVKFVWLKVNKLDICKSLNF